MFDSRIRVRIGEWTILVDINNSYSCLHNDRPFQDFGHTAYVGICCR